MYFRDPKEPFLKVNVFLTWMTWKKYTQIGKLKFTLMRGEEPFFALHSDYLYAFSQVPTLKNLVYQNSDADCSLFYLWTLYRNIILMYLMENLFCRPVRSLDHLLSTMHLLFRVHRVWIIAIFCINTVHPRLNRLRCRLGFKHDFESKLCLTS